MILKGKSADDAEKATFAYRKIYVEKYISESELYRGMFEVIEALKKSDIYVAITTMKTETRVNTLLDIFSIVDMFDAIETVLDQGGRKTKDDYSGNTS